MDRTGACDRKMGQRGTDLVSILDSDSTINVPQVGNEEVTSLPALYVAVYLREQMEPLLHHD